MYLGYDCGVFIMCFTDALCAMKLKGEKEKDKLTSIGQNNTNKMRTEVQSLIAILAKE